MTATLNLAVRETAVYRLFDADDRLLYVGMTCNPDARLKWHKQNSPWWPEVRRKALIWCEDREVAEEEERSAIRLEKPLHNVNGHGTPCDRHLDKKLAVRVPQGLLDEAQATAIEAGWTLQEMVTALLSKACVDSEEVFAAVERYRPAPKRIGRPPKGRAEAAAA